MAPDFIPNTEMGKLIRAKDWGRTSLGPMDTWPQSLKTTLSIILHSKFPMFLFWGPEHICLYNDAYRPSLGIEGKHPVILGMPAREAWAEIWSIIEPLINQVLAGGEATWSEDQLIPIYRNGKLEDVYWTFSYSPVMDESGKPAAVLVTCTETTQKVLAHNRLQANTGRFKDTVQQAPVGIAILRGNDFTFEIANEVYLQLVDKREHELVDKKLFDVLPEVQLVVEPLLRGVMETGIAYHAPQLQVDLNRFGRTTKAYFNLTYKPLFEKDVVTGIIVVANEVTEFVEAQHALQEQQRHFRNLIMDSPIAMTIWRGPEYVIEVANRSMLTEVWRKQEQDVIGKKALDVFPELNNQKYPELLKKVITTGVAHRENESLAYVQGDDGMKEFYLDFEYSPLVEVDGSISGLMITVYNVTERVESRNKLMDAESRLRLAIEATGLSTWDLDLKTRAIIHSARLAVIFGYPESHVLTHVQMRSHLLEADRLEVVDKAFEIAMKTGTYEYEARIIRVDGVTRWIRTHGKVVFDRTNTPKRMLGTLADVTDQKLAAERSSRLVAIVESSDDAIISKRLDGTITSWNKGAEGIFGYTAEEMIGQHISKLIPPERSDEEPKIIARLVKGEQVEHIETQRLTKYITLIDLSLTISPLRDNNGNVVGASKIARDISKQKQTERRILENEQRLQMVIEASALGIWELDLITKELTYSKRYLEIFGFKADQKPTHEELLERIHPDDLPIREKAFEKANKTGELHYVVRVIWPDGSIHWMEGRGSVFFDAVGNPVRMSGTNRDSTEEKAFAQALENMVIERTQELRHANVELEKRNTELASFAYVSSHDLQEPLRKIQTFASRIVEKEYENLSDNGKNYFQRMQESARRMQLLIRDLLTYSRTNTTEQEFVEIDLNTLITEITSELEQTIQEKRATLEVDKLPVVQGIYFQMQQLFTNLIGNALKFAKEDEPLHLKISCKTVDRIDSIQQATPAQRYYEITVADNGIGFEDLYSARIFEVFQRLHTTRAYEGTGIGLAICKKIVENHHGFITAQGELGKGATFTIYLPVE
jgi:PAS domain S-box-containing protein